METSDSRPKGTNKGNKIDARFCFIRCIDIDDAVLYYRNANCGWVRATVQMPEPQREKGNVTLLAMLTL